MKKVKRDTHPDTILASADSVSPILSIFLICAAGILVYSNTYTSSFHFDDNLSIVGNQIIQSPDAPILILRNIPTRFFAYLSFAANYQINGLDVTGYHIVNTVIHISSGLVLWWLIQLLFGTPILRETPAARYKKILSLAGALIFIVHPVQTQAVTYIVQRIASLSTLLYLGGLSSYIRARIERYHRNIKILFLCLSVLISIMALLTKETAYTLPYAIVLVEFFFMRTTMKSRSVMFICAIGVSVIVPLIMLLTGKTVVTEEPGISRIEYLLTQFTVIPTYMRLLVLPIHQNLDYEITVIRSLSNPWALGGLALIVVILTAGVLLYRRHRLLSFGIFWFFLTLSVESSIIPIRDLMFEHRLYLPMAGFCFIVVALIEFAGRYVSHTYVRYTVLAIVLVFGVTAYARNEVWKNDVSLWGDCIKTSPNKSRGYLNRGLAYHKEERYDEALRDYTTAIRLDSTNWAAISNMGAILEMQGKLDSAIAFYTHAIEMSRGKNAEPFYGRSTAYTRKGMYKEALHDLNEFVYARPYDALAFYKRGCVQRLLQNPKDAISDISTAISIDSSEGVYFFDRGVLSMHLGNTDGALSDFNSAIRRGSHDYDCYVNKGFILTQRRAYTEAIAQYTLALQYEPNSVHVLNDRGLAYLDNREYDRALDDLNNAIHLDSLNPLLYKNRFAIYQALGEHEKAQQDLLKAGVLLVHKKRVK
jgi:protein O-mannosyl-transferase